MSPKVPAPGMRAPALPDVMSEGELYGHLGRYAGRMVVTAAEMIGGVERLAAWADKNESDFWTKVFPKTVARPSFSENQHTVTIEDKIQEIRGRMLQGEFTDVTDVEPGTK